MPPFSGKQKKKQLQERRQRKKQQDDGGGARGHTHHAERCASQPGDDDHHARKEEEEYKYGADRKGIRSVFRKETAEEIAARKKLLFEPLAERRFMDDGGIPFGSWFNVPGHTGAAQMPFSVEMPTRGWAVEGAAAVSKGEVEGEENDVEAWEEARFKAYLNVVDNYPLPPALQDLQLNAYERNLDVWRQLWRTVEQSDVVVIVADVRYTILHLPLSLLFYVVRQCRKPCVVVLNKADLVPRPILDKWMEFLPMYFRATGVVAANETEAKASGVACEIPLLPFTSLPADETAFGAEDAGNAARRRKKNKRRMKLYEQLRTGKLQLGEMFLKDNSAGDAKESCGSSDEGENDNTNNNTDDDDDDDDMTTGGKEDAYAETENFKGKHRAEWSLQCEKRRHKELEIVSDMIVSLLRRCRDMCISERHPSADGKEEDEEERPVHIGFVGHPNVGKSSLLNCIRGTKVVSVSATPGHTKHLQTIPIPSERVVLIDSPGLVFPVFGLPRALQAVIGTHQIAQTRDPQSGVAFLALHLKLEQLYGLRKVDGADDTVGWSPYDLCESYAKKRGYFVKRGKGALDVHRGAVEILQEAYEGRLVLFFAPPDTAWLESAQFREEVRPRLLLTVCVPETAVE